MPVEIDATKSRKIVEGDINVYFSFISLILTVSTSKVFLHVLSFLIFLGMCVYADWKTYLRLLKPPMFFLIPSIAVLTFVSGLDVAVHTFIRAIASVTILFYLVMTSTLPEIFTALKKLKLPEVVVELSMLIYRVIQSLYAELERTENAAKSRLGLIDKRTMFRTASLLSYQLFLRSLRRAEVMDKAMEARCYNGEMPTFSKRTRNAYFAVAICLTLFTLLVVGEL